MWLSCTSEADQPAAFRALVHRVRGYAYSQLRQPDEAAQNSSRASRRREKATRCTSWRSRSALRRRFAARRWKLAKRNASSRRCKSVPCQRCRWKWVEGGARCAASASTCGSELGDPAHGVGERVEEQGDHAGSPARVRDPGCTAASAGTPAVVEQSTNRPGSRHVAPLSLLRHSFEIGRHVAGGVPGIDFVVGRWRHGPRVCLR